MATSETSESHTKPPSEKDESKDFVEHLRMVHFALLATCVALIVIVLGSSNDRAKNAIEQLDIVSNTASAFKANGWVGRQGLEFSERQQCGKSAKTDLPPFPQSVLWTITTPDFHQINKPLLLDPASNLKTLADFKDIWDVEFVFVCPAEWAAEPYAEMPAENTFQVAKFVHNSELPLQLSKMAHQDFTYLFRPADKTKFSMFDVTKIKAERWSMKDLIRRRLPKKVLPYGNFKEAFYDLDQATSGIQNEANFVLVRRVLELQQKNSTGVFEAFGQKFPIESAARWGVLIITCIQFYFWLHLSEYYKRHFSSSPTPWIGSYTSGAARFLFSLTAIITPFAVVVFVCFKAGLLPKEMIIRNWLLCSLAIIASVILSGLSWRMYLKHNAIRP